VHACDCDDPKKETNNVIHVSMGDQKEVLGNSPRWAATNIKGYFKCGEKYTCFMASNGQTPNLVSFNVQIL